MTATLRIAAALLAAGSMMQATAARALQPAAVAASDSVNVAAPTGDTNSDRANVQAAFDAVQPGGTVQFAPGTYLLGAGARLTVPDVTVLGHPDGGRERRRSESGRSSKPLPIRRGKPATMSRSRSCPVPVTTI